jgi:hypothetical protein
MTEADLEKIKEACKPVPYIIVGGVAPRSQQENANAAWAELGARMGFDHMTVQSNGKGNRFFSAVPSETPEQRAERVAKEADEKRQAEIVQLRQEIHERNERLTELEKE